MAIAKNRTDTRIYVRGDKNINYGRVLEVMGTLSGAGFSKVALISEPYKIRMIYDKEFNLFNYFSLNFSFVDHIKFTIHA